MRVAMYYHNHDVRLEELPTPRIGPGELLLKVVASGICGSDVMEWYRVKKAPRVLGHEVAGDVVEVGADLEGFRVGQRVVVTHHVPCNTCPYCLRGQHTLCDTLRTTNFDPGGFAEYLRVPRINIAHGGVLALPDEVSYAAGTFVEPLGCALRGMRVARFQPGQSVLVLGSGLAGVLSIMLARAMGAGRIIATDVNAHRLRVAHRFGADVVLDAREGNVPEQVRQANAGRGAEQVFVCTAVNVAFEQALDAVDRGGSVLLYAINEPDTEMPFKVYNFWLKGITLTSTYGASPLDLSLALELLRAGRLPVEETITHRLPLAETGRGFQLVTAAQDSLKVIVEPNK